MTSLFAATSAATHTVRTKICNAQWNVAAASSKNQLNILIVKVTGHWIQGVVSASTHLAHSVAEFLLTYGGRRLQNLSAIAKRVFAECNKCWWGQFTYRIRTARLQPKGALVDVEETLLFDPNSVECATSIYPRIVVVPSLQAGISTA